MKKNEKLLMELGEIGDDYIEEASPSAIKSRKQKRRRLFALITAACLTLTLLVPIASLIINYDNLARYEDSPYYSIIKKIDAYRDKQNDRWSIGDLIGGAGIGAPEMDGASGGSSAPTSPSGGVGNYEEVTDNQVSGVVEADIIKRTDKYIFQLLDSKLKVYSIKGEESECVSTLNLNFGLSSGATAEMYLSAEDGLITAISCGTNNQYQHKTVVLSIDISDLNNMRVTDKAEMDGKYISSRMVDGRLMVMTEYYFNYRGVDYSKPETFIPSVKVNSKSALVPMQNIISPGEITATRYTVVSSFGGEGLEYLGSGAFLSYSDTVYVSEDSIYATRSFTENKKVDGRVEYEVKSEISIMSYKGGAHSVVGSIVVSGSIKDRFSMDQYDGMLRIVTTVNKHSYVTSSNGESSSAGDFRSSVSASLFIYDLESLELIASKEEFAPQGETVQSARFDKTEAYVCTSVELMDPVFFFDLSDISNITSKDTGTITGFSTSLIDFGSFLLGVGRESFTDLKIEVYEETAEGVRAVDSYILRQVYYPSEYKAYYINRDESLIGMSVLGYSGELRYILLYFNGYEIIEIASVPLYVKIDENLVRGVCIGDHLYVLGAELKVVKYKNV